MWGGVGVNVERTRFASVTCVGAPEISGGRSVRGHSRDLVPLGGVGTDELTLFRKECSTCVENLWCADFHTLGVAIWVFDLSRRGQWWRGIVGDKLSWLLGGVAE